VAYVDRYTSPSLIIRIILMPVPPVMMLDGAKADAVERIAKADNASFILILVLTSEKV